MCHFEQVCKENLSGSPPLLLARPPRCSGPAWRTALQPRSPRLFKFQAICLPDALPTFLSQGTCLHQKWREFIFSSILFILFRAWKFRMGSPKAIIQKELWGKKFHCSAASGLGLVGSCGPCCMITGTWGINYPASTAVICPFIMVLEHHAIQQKYPHFESTDLKNLQEILLLFCLFRNIKLQHFWQKKKKKFIIWFWWAYLNFLLFCLSENENISDNVKFMKNGNVLFWLAIVFFKGITQQIVEMNYFTALLLPPYPLLVAEGMKSPISLKQKEQKQQTEGLILFPLQMWDCPNQDFWVLILQFRVSKRLCMEDTEKKSEFYLWILFYTWTSLMQ